MSEYLPRRLSFPLPSTPLLLTRNIFNILSVQLFFAVIFLILAGKSLAIKKFLMRQAFLCVLMLLICIASAITLSNNIITQEKAYSPNNSLPTTACSPYSPSPSPTSSAASPTSSPPTPSSPPSSFISPPPHQ